MGKARAKKTPGTHRGKILMGKEKKKKNCNLPKKTATAAGKKVLTETSKKTGGGQDKRKNIAEKS